MRSAHDDGDFAHGGGVSRHGDGPSPRADGVSPREDGAFDRRRLFGLSGALLLGGLATASCTGHADPRKPSVQAPPPNGVLGVNFNGEPASVTDRQLQDLTDTWVRGFVPTQKLDNTAAQEQPTVRRLLDLSSRGFGTVLSLKFPYSGKRVPEPGEPAMRRELHRLDELLPAVLGKVDILVIGNEPFIESEHDDQNSGRLNAFYEHIAQHVVHHKAAPGKTQFYMGSLNHLDDPAWRTAATERWMTFTRETPEIRGVDIHPHLPDPGADRQYLDYVLPKLRDDQKFLATEFSLVLFWKKHLKDPVAAEFAQRHHIDPQKKVWQVVKQAIDEPFPQQKWDDFTTMTPWLHDHAGYLREQLERFRRTGRLAVATYGVTQGPSMVEHFNAGSTPWLLNSLYCPFTVRRRGNGLPGGNLGWVQQFRDAQKS